MVLTRANRRQLQMPPPHIPDRTRRHNAARRQWRKQYRPTDPYHRHRLHDNQPKTQRVTSYTRRL